MATKRKCLNQKDKSKRAEARGQKQVKGQSKSLKVSSFPSLGFFFCFLACFFSLVFEKKKTRVLHHYLILWCYNKKDNDSLMSLLSSLC